MRRALGLVALCALGVVLYAHTLDVPFYFDDSQNIVENPRIRLVELDAAGLWSAAFESPSPRPLAHLSFALNYRLGRYDVGGYHLANIAIHVLAGLTVWGLAARTFALAGRAAAGGPALFAAALFLAHPIQTQAVTYVVQRMTSLAALLYLVALLLWLLGRERAGRARVALWLAAALAWGASLGSKQIGIVLPLAALLYEWLFFRRRRGGARLRGAAVAGLVLVPVLMGAAAFALLGTSPLDRLFAGYEIRDFTLAERLLTQPRVVLSYVGLLILPLPSRQSLVHAVATSHGWLDPPTTLLAWGAVALGIWFAFWIARRDPLISLALLWFGLHLVVESSVLPLEMAFEHRLYLPMFGVALGASHVLFFVVPGSLRAKRVAAAALIGLLGIATVARNEMWRDPVAFWSQVVAEAPDRFRTRNNLALALSRAGRVEESVSQYRAAIRIDPNVAAVHSNLGHALEQTGRRDEAISHLGEAVRLDPENVGALNNLGNALLLAGRRDEAVALFRRAVEVDPEYAAAHYNLGAAAADTGQLDAAVQHYRDALRIRPDFARAHDNLGMALAKRGEVDEAIDHYEQAIQLDPGYARAHNNLGVAFARSGRVADAIGSFEQALRLDPDYTEARKNLATARSLVRGDR